jgi:hypothetical protein
MSDEPENLADELGVEGLGRVVFGNRGRLFSAAGRKAPIAEFAGDFLIMHPPDKPFAEQGASEVIEQPVSERGVLIDELGNEKKLPTAKFHGQPLFWFHEKKPGSSRNYVCWFDEDGKAQKIYMGESAITVDVAFKLRNRTHDGELSIFEDLSKEPRAD